MSGCLGGSGVDEILWIFKAGEILCIMAYMSLYIYPNPYNVQLWEWTLKCISSEWTNSSVLE